MKKSLGPILIVAALVALSLGAAAWLAGRKTVDVLTDGAGLDLAYDIARPRDVLWRTPEPLDEHPVPEGAVGGAFSADGGRFAFAAPGPEGDLDLFEAVLTPRGWSEPRRIEALCSLDHDTTPTFGPDGRLWFSSDRAGGAGGYDLWVAANIDDDWAAPEPASSIVPGLAESAADELHPALSPDGSLLCFARRADAASPFDIVALDPRSGEPRDDIAALVDTPGNDRSPAFSPAGDFLYFASDREGGAGGLDLYRVRLTGEAPREVWWLGEEVNSPGDEDDPSLTMAGFRLRFRAEADGGSSYLQTTAREVYRTVRSTWSLAIGSQILRLLPWILLALALVLLLAGLRRLARSGDWQRRLGTLGLMARCVLASCVIHAVIALLLNLWSIQTTMPGSGDDSTTRVALTTSRSVDAAAAQLLAPAVADAPAPADDAQPDLAMEAAPPTQQRIDAARAAPTVLPTAVADATNTSAAALSTPAPAETRVVEAASVPNARQVDASESSSSSLAPVDASRATPTPDAAAARPVEVASAPTRIETARSTVAESSMSIAVRSDAPRLEDSAPQDISASAMPSQSASRVEESSSASRVPAMRESRAALTPDASATVASPAPPASTSTPLPRPTLAESGAAPAPSSVVPRAADINVSLPSLDDVRMPAAPQQAESSARALRLPDAEARPRDAAPSVETHAMDVRIAPSASSAAHSDIGGALRDASVQQPRSNPLFAAAPPAAEVLASPLPTGEAQSPPSRPDEPRLAALEERSPSAPTVLAAPAPVLDLRPNPRAASAEASIPRESIRDVRLPTPTTSATAATSDAPSIRAPMLPAGRLIAGVVVDATSGAPIPNARVRLDGDGDLIRSAVTDDDGRFSMTPAELPEFAALTAAADDYQTGTANVAERDVGDGAWVEFRLQPVNRFAIAFEEAPEVHHLGNDRFSGRINSQFQVRSEGTIYRAVVTLDADQLPPVIERAALVIAVRGAQNPNLLSINGQVLPTRLDESPSNGSFGEFIADVPVRLLVPGQNVLEIQAVQRQNTDIDDFEFVNPMLFLKPAGAGRGSGREAL